MKEQLSQQQIDQLIRQGCTAQDWSRIRICNKFDATRIRHTHFYGDIVIGENTHFPNGVNLEEQGISHSILRNVTIGNGTCINYAGLIEGYTIGNNVRICRTNELITDKWINTELRKDGITVGNEAGNPNIHFTLSPNEKLDWLGVHYPHLFHPDFIEEDKHTTDERPTGFIQDQCSIINTGTIRNVNIEQDVTINGAANLEEGMLCKGCYIGNQVIAKKFIIGKRTRITDGAKLYHVITTNNCKIGKGFMAENCYFCHHSELFCGEACAIFAGPHTVSHHKSTLLIGGEFSFYNAGSNTNQSNHAYKLGPVHYGVLSRGSKTASGSHILWPMQTAPFTMVMGKVKTHPDLSALPFSYVIADSDKVFVVPGINLGTSGTYRDIMKWKQRGQSPYIGEYHFMSPWVMQSVFKGIDILQELQQAYGPEVEVYPYNGTFIRRRALEKGLDRYHLAIRLYAGKIHPTENIFPEAKDWHWIDIAGQPYVEEELEEIHELMRTTNNFDEEDIINKLNECYATQAQQWGATMLSERYGKDFTSGFMQQNSKEALEEWKSLLIADAYKELALGDVSTELVEEFISKVKETEIESL